MSIPIPPKEALSLHLNWTRCEGNVWCKLNSVNLEHAHFNNKPCGVYIIWHGGTKPWAVYVGQGDIKERIAEHRKDLVHRGVNHAPYRHEQQNLLDCG